MSSSCEIELLLITKVNGTFDEINLHDHKYILTQIEKIMGYFIPKTKSHHIDYSCKTMMSCGMFMSFATL
jgi:hypothetical protein